MTVTVSQPPIKPPTILDREIDLERREQLYRSVAAQIAKDVLTPDEIIRAHGLTQRDYDALMNSPVFAAMVTSATAAWVSAENAPERVKLKFQHMIEQSAPEMFAALIDNKNSLGDRTRLLQTLMKGANIGEPVAFGQGGGGGGNKISINITMGGDAKMHFEKQIDGNVNRVPSGVSAATIDYMDGVEVMNGGEGDSDELFDQLMEEDA